ncbi:MAG: hypothetical protein J5651_00145 [Salinivirgaceae bacterium]|nr:hypothetical protein [Salinivirgaceae bacterium]
MAGNKLSSSVYELVQHGATPVGGDKMYKAITKGDCTTAWLLSHNLKLNITSGFTYTATRVVAVCDFALKNSNTNFSGDTNHSDPTNNLDMTPNVDTGHGGGSGGTGYHLATWEYRENADGSMEPYDSGQFDGGITGH